MRVDHLHSVGDNGDDAFLSIQSEFGNILAIKIRND